MARLKRRPSPVDEANDQVPIRTACALIGMRIPAEVGSSLKVHCPFGAVWHSDHGREPAMRIYPESNHAHCFSRCGHFTPVALVATCRGISQRAAARELLAHIGHSRNLADLWHQATHHDRPPDRVLLGEALKTFCARTCPDWPDIQFSSDIAALLTRCLSLLDRVNTADDAVLWLDTCKQVMAKRCHPIGGSPRFDGETGTYNSV